MSFKEIISQFRWDAPLVGLGPMKVAGLTLETWLVVLGVLYGVARIVALVLDVYWKWEDRRNGKSK